MPARVTVFCREALGIVTNAMVRDALEATDLMTLAECLDLPEGEEEAVDRMWRELRLGAPADEVAEIHWSSDHRAIQVTVEPPLLGEIEETLTNLPPATSAAAEQVRDHIAHTRQIVRFEMSFAGAEHLAATITEVIAFDLAQRGNGLVWFYHREFASPTDRGATLWTADG